MIKINLIDKVKYESLLTIVVSIFFCSWAIINTIAYNEFDIGIVCFAFTLITGLFGYFQICNLVFRNITKSIDKHYEESSVNKKHIIVYLVLIFFTFGYTIFIFIWVITLIVCNLLSYSILFSFYLTYILTIISCINICICIIIHFIS
jgi:hypothetical protein